MDRKIFAKLFWLITAFVTLSLIICTAAFAGTGSTNTASAQSPQQVVVSNSAAQPVPMNGLV